MWDLNQVEVPDILIQDSIHANNGNYRKNHHIFNMPLSVLSDNGTFIIKTQLYLIEANCLLITEILLLQSCQYSLHLMKCESVR